MSDTERVDGVNVLSVGGYAYAGEIIGLILELELNGGKKKEVGFGLTPRQAAQVVVALTEALKKQLN